ncbi:MAG TPA: hypothetical protein VGL46_04040 [Pseudonocardiaceae bacterium]
MITHPLTEGGLDRGRAPDLKSPHWRCGIVDPSTTAVCTRGLPGCTGHRPFHPPRPLDRRPERAMVVAGYTWDPRTRTGIEVRALATTPRRFRWCPEVGAQRAQIDTANHAAEEH